MHPINIKEVLGNPKEGCQPEPAKQYRATGLDVFFFHGGNLVLNQHLLATVGVALLYFK